ncbi:hypothetical protein FIBSPDRAFT_748459 [Athelia psychrophila]|uniref:Translation machinery-associated protein 16 n=1 Tax=Athelia psychrophila TaxID=1759441 RepID=A0A166FAB9_9AGAM|nr:hypothetical protein FIBSPDRAFT_748459 [Fibularhizoctonia sp. CBS 109695]
MAPSEVAKKAASKAKKPKKEKIFHPESRKAGQLARTQLRKSKVTAANSKRHKRFAREVDVYSFFFHALPEEGVLTLEELHGVLRDVWLTRHDEELEEERVARRKGRPKSAKEMKFEEEKLQEMEEYRTGMEVIDLTHTPTVELFRRWDQKEFAYIQMLRYIRISSSEPSIFVVSKPGKHHTLGAENDDGEAPQLMDVIHESSVDNFLGVQHISRTSMII